MGCFLLMSQYLSFTINGNTEFFCTKGFRKKSNFSIFQTLVMYKLQVKRLICMLNLIMWIGLFSMCMRVCRMEAQKTYLSPGGIRKGFTNYFSRSGIMTLHMNENWWFRDTIVFRATVLYTANLSSFLRSVTESHDSVFTGKDTKCFTLARSCEISHVVWEARSYFTIFSRRILLHTCLKCLLLIQY